MLKLKPSQIEAVKLLKFKKKAFLTNNCGSGKTLIALSLAKDLKLSTLIICSKSKLLDWEAEAKKINFTNYTLTTYNRIYKEIKHKFQVILVDESQNMGDFNTKKGKAIILQCRAARYVVFISATPIKTKPTDVYWPLKLCRAINMNKDEFRIRYCGAYIHKFLKLLVDAKFATNVKELKAILDANSVYTSGADRKLKIRKHIINLNFDIARYIKKRDAEGRLVKRDNVPAFEETAAERAEIGLQKFEIFKKFAKRQKLPKRVVFFTHHRKITQGMAEFLGCDMIIGGMTTKQRDLAIQKFNNKQTNRIIISLKSGSEGINLFNCTTCFFVELDFSPTVYRQAYQRLAREQTDMTIDAYFFKVLNEHSTIVNEYKDSLLNKLEEK